MASYLPSDSNVKGDAMQTLYLMNPSYTGYSTDSTNPGNMVLASPQAGNTAQHQQYDGFSLPPHISQQSQMALMPMPNPHNLDHPNASSSEMFTSSANSQGFSWNGGGNELMFIPSSNMRDDSSALATRMTSIQPNSSLPHMGIRSDLSQAAFQEEHVPFIPTGVSLVENHMQVPTSHGHGHGHGHGQILSLSLSPQPSMLNQMQAFPIQQHLELGVSNDHDFGGMGAESYPAKGKFANQWTDGGSSSLREISPNVIVPGYQGQLISAPNSSRQYGMFPSTPPKADIYGSKFLKPVQELLNEVVSIVRDTKSNSSIPSNKSQAWASPSPYGNASFQMKQNPVETAQKDGNIPTASWGSEKEIVPAPPNMPNSAADVPQQNAESVMELTASEKQDIQMKKAKLMTILDEVEQRYRHYHHQMQIVVTSFESTAGFGSARTYTELALQTISKHFRCLKDAIKGQIRVACKALGEEDSLGLVQQGRGETSRLRFIDQQLRQQRALQHLGMMQQHPWRPQRGLPERSVSVLRAWLFEHFLHPYPKDSDKVLLARQTGLTRNQVSNWFINARVRLWKPMVEEMYAEEMRDMEGGGVEETDRSGQGQSEGQNQNNGDERSQMIEVPNKSASLGANFLTQPKSEGLHDVNYITPGGASEDIAPARNGVKPSPESFAFHDDHGVVKKARTGLDSSSSSLTSSFVSPSVLSASLNYKGDELQMIPEEEEEEEEEEESESLEPYGSMFQLSRLNRFPNEVMPANYGPPPFPPAASASNNSNSSVSLTLGLQHSEGLSLSGNPHQPYMEGHGQLNMVGRHVNPSTYYGMHNGPWQLRGFDSSS